MKALLVDNAQPLALAAGEVEQGRGVVDLQAVLAEKLPDVRKPAWEKGTGTGGLDGARGSIRVYGGDVELGGEQDIFAEPWEGSRWSQDTGATSAWSGGTWRGSRWTCAGWSTSLLWETTTRTDSSWARRDWAGSRWSGMAWDGSRWTGSRW